MDYFEREIEKIKKESNYRELPKGKSIGEFIYKDNKKMINLASNDYLGIASDIDLRNNFISKINKENFIPSYSSSRLLSGGFDAFEELEESLSRLFHSEDAMVFNSGYHANIGIIPAISDSKTLILADKLIHASLIDGILLSKSKFLRYHHNDYEHLEELIEKNKRDYEMIIIASESIFSMDGDEADLLKLVDIKEKHNNILLYIDEAHAIGVRGETGLGLAQEKNCIDKIDFLVGTFGKAIGSVGAYIICKKVIKEFLINKMRSFIFSTALPPINIAWTNFVINNLNGSINYKQRKTNLDNISRKLREAIINKGIPCTSTSHIIPYIIGDSSKAMQKSNLLQENGFYALAVRPPTVAKGTSRIRFSLNSNIKEEEILSLIKLL